MSSLGATRSASIAAHSACAVARDRLSYNWPIKPFREPHPVRGNFGDPRTIFVDGTSGSFSFHNGVDIVAADGTPVYPVVSGHVRIASDDAVIVDTRDGRTFQYWHLVPAAHVGENVVSGQTVLGHIRAPFNHVHLTEIRDGIVQNPLAPGHLMPYSDSLSPVVERVSFLAIDGSRLAPTALRGDVVIVANAYDLPSLPVPGAWYGMPVTPAALTWRVTSASGTSVVPERVAIDFRSSEPDNEAFWQIYRQGTHQNFPVVDGRYLFGHAGAYLFDLTPRPLDVSSLPAGRYVLTVTALDVCGNTGSLSEPIDVLPHPEPPPALPATRPALPRRPLGPIAWPANRSGYTVVLASLPGSAGASGARSVARRARATGLQDVGFLYSSRYSSLRPGYWVVFSGVYASSARAQAAARLAVGRYSGATVRPVVPRVALSRWPHGQSGYTIVLASLPTSAGLAAARDEARQATAAGLGRVGVLVSAHFGNLEPGYYVVFSGVYRRGELAQRALTRISAIYPGAYPRAIGSG